MTQEQKQRFLKADEQAKQEGQAALRVLGPPNNVESLCGTCGGVVVTVVFGGTDRPQIRVRPGARGRQHIHLHDRGGSNAARTSLLHEACCTGQGTVPGSPKITLICGECGARLISFEGVSND
jgi:hypothetical protein